MKTTLEINSRGAITLPAKFRKALGLSPNDTLIAETTEDGLLLRPAAVLPVEIYSRERRAEFAAAEDQLEQWYRQHDKK